MTNAEDNDINSEDDLFYFETDHLALRGNKDYSEVLKTLVILCAQSKQAIKDYNTAAQLKKEALEDPGKVLEKIVKNEPLGMPDMQCLPELPVIDWSKYNVKIPDDALNFIYSGSNVTKKKQHTPKKDSKISHQKWSAEEQKRLEELLQMYPPEPFENRRFKKIADALGNRTIQQVSSRVQKYFIKLYKAGLPVPGRIPKSGEKYKRSQHKHQRHNHYLLKPTTFFPELCVPVVMNDLENVPGPSTKFPVDIPQASSSSNYLIPSGYHEGKSEVPVPKNESELQIAFLKKIRKIKLKEEESAPNFYSHVGFKCDYCDCEPIVGTRWHCSVCTNVSVDFCTDCAITQIYSDTYHPLNHNIVPYYDADTPYPSDSESVNGIKQELSDSSESEFQDEDDEETSDKNAGCSNVGNLNGSMELQETSALKNQVFNETNDVSYTYLHSNLSLDME